ncbi:hypothetical protein Gpo141_00009369 [Globisporangium polare]
MQSATTEAYLRLELLYAHVLEILNQCIADLLLTVAQAERLLQNAATPQGHEMVPQGDTREMNAALLGLSAASLRRGVGLSDDKQLRAFEEMAQISLLPRIERKLRMKCTELCDIMLPGLAQSHNHTIDASRGASSSISRIAELPALLLEAQARKAQLEQETEQLKDHLHAQLLQDIERCRAMTSLVAQLLIDHKRDDQTRVLHAKIQWLAAFSEAMRLKAQVLTSQLVVETYTPEKIDALRAAQTELQARKSKALEERDMLQAKLQLYQNADPQYHAIAHEYGSVLRSIEEKRNWLNSLAL